MTVMTRPAEGGVASPVGTSEPDAPVQCPLFVDPLDADDPDDDVVVTTRRGICRVALVAAEAASRFQRDGVPHDAMTWMLAPRRLFGGAAAIDACVELDPCVRAMLMHGLSLGLDADPEDVDGLAADEEEDDIDWSEPVEPEGAPEAPPPARVGVGRLFTAVVASHDGFECVQAFHASIARDEAEVAGRLYGRLGAAAADADIVDGFDATSPLVEALVAPAMRHMLELVETDPGSPLAFGLDVNIEQRFLE